LKELEAVLGLLGFEKFVSPFNVLQYSILLLFSQHNVYKLGEENDLNRGDFEK